MYLSNLWTYDWELTTSPAGAKQWVPKDGAGKGTVPDAHDPAKSHQPIMFTTDLALKMDPEYAKISKRFFENPKEFEQAFAKAWYKLTHRDMGPMARYLGPEVPKEALIWQDPIPAVDHELVNDADIASLKQQILASVSRPRSSFPPPGPRPRPSAVPICAAAPTEPASVSPRRRIGR